MANISSLINVEWFLGIPWFVTQPFDLDIVGAAEAILGDTLIGLQVAFSLGQRPRSAKPSPSPGCKRAGPLLRARPPAFHVRPLRLLRRVLRPAHAARVVRQGPEWEGPCFGPVWGSAWQLSALPPLVSPLPDDYEPIADAPLRSLNRRRGLDSGNGVGHQLCRCIQREPGVFERGEVSVSFWLLPCFWSPACSRGACQSALLRCLLTGERMCGVERSRRRGVYAMLALYLVQDGLSCTVHSSVGKNETWFSAEPHYLLYVRAGV